MKLQKVSAAIAIIALVGAGVAFAQEDPDMDPEEPGMPGMQPEVPEVELEDDELERFAEALVDVQMIQQEAQVEVQEVIDDSPLSIERFQEIYQGEMAPEMGEVDVDDDEQLAFDEALDTIEQIEIDAAAEMEAAVDDQDLDVERFNLLAQAIPQDPELSQELNEIAQEIMQERGMGQDPGGGF